jgi:hypothetical protein
MSNEKISAFLSLLAALVVIIMNFYPWYDITFNGKPKIQRWGKVALFFSLILIIASSIILFIPNK